MNTTIEDEMIMSERETLVNYNVRYIPGINSSMDDQVNLKTKAKELIFKRKWYQLTRKYK